MKKSGQWIALKSLARRILELGDEIAMLDELIKPIVEKLAPQLLDRIGIGIEIAGQLLVTAGDNRERMRGEPSWAMLCGVAPLPASCDMTQRHRLNRGGDRQANSALHLAVISRLRIDPATQACAARKTVERHSKLEIIRCLKRYLAREVYYLLNPRPAARHRNLTTGEHQGWWAACGICCGRIPTRPTIRSTRPWNRARKACGHCGSPSESSASER